MKKCIAVCLALLLCLFLWACTPQNDPTSGAQNGQTIQITDMIGREVTVTPGSYRRVVCIGAGALRMYSYIGDTALLAGVPTGVP